MERMAGNKKEGTDEYKGSERDSISVRGDNIKG